MAHRTASAADRHCTDAHILSGVIREFEIKGLQRFPSPYYSSHSDIAS